MDVVGTEFVLERSERTLRVATSRGIVRVRSDHLNEERRLNAGQSLEISIDPETTEDPEDQPRHDAGQLQCSPKLTHLCSRKLTHP